MLIRDLSLSSLTKVAWKEGTSFIKLQYFIIDVLIDSKSYTVGGAPLSSVTNSVLVLTEQCISLIYLLSIVKNGLNFLFTRPAAILT